MRDKNKVKSAYAVSTISVTFVLFLIGIALYLAANAERAADSIVENIKVTLVLNDDVTKQELSEIKTTLKSMSDVSKVEYVSKAAALKNFGKYIDSEVITSFEVNPLPAVYNIFLVKNGDLKQLIKGIEGEFKSKKYFSELLQQSSEMDKVIANLHSLRIMVAIFLAILLFISIVLINNTIRMNIYSKRFIIKTMQLIGATNWFIRKPFFKVAFMQGFIASLIAFIMVLGMIIGLKKTLPLVEIIDNYEILAILYGVINLIGISLCVIMTNRSVGKHIRSGNDKLHIY